jgi:ketosteroid isomerase-like protein
MKNIRPSNPVRTRRGHRGFAPVLLALALSVWGAAEARSQTAADEIRQVIANYAAAVNVEPLNLRLASRVWENSPDVSLIFPRGREQGWEQIKKNFYQGTMEALFSERRLTPRDIRVHVYGDSAWAEFAWHFTAKLRKDGSTVQSEGRETQIYRRAGPHHWVLVHVHYSGGGAAERPAAARQP